ncbi:hypothetical protein GCM10022214_10900 [Actinomadura miaoliensis]|uniref:Ryanodine receptor Ryr domain-containing protein n=1 Tax=Actinomadura miaoliensis TaxID=430685 RepID=A0ABP7V5W9_9ACTN
MLRISDSATRAAYAPVVLFSLSVCDLLFGHRPPPREREGDGWRFGRLRDDERKLQPDMVDWQHLSEHARDKGRDAVRALPQILADAGYQIVRLAPRRTL